MRGWIGWDVFWRNKIRRAPALARFIPQPIPPTRQVDRAFCRITRQGDRSMMEIARKAALGVLLVVLVAIAGALVWLLNPSTADTDALLNARADPRVIVTKRDGFTVIRPAATAPKIGLAFYPGLHVAPDAYLFKLTDLSAAANIQIVIGRPFLTVAFLSMRQADRMQHSVPEVTRWYVGGHSMGASAACMYAASHAPQLDGVILFGASCGSDISATSLRVLSVSGANDGLFPPQKIAAARDELPLAAQIVIVPGMNHGQFANYGAQFGDLPAGIDDMAALDAVRQALVRFLQP
jgi:hypothetical protein